MISLGGGIEFTHHTAADKAAKQRQIRMRRWSVACLCGAVNNSG